MALLEQQTVVGNGMVKEIEESAMSLVLQNLQQDHYQYPIKSFIREISSNAVDSIEEKKAAVEILNGKAKVEDYYSDIESDITKDSKFDSNYYDLNHLNSEDIVNITYVNRDKSFTNRDLIIIEDSGVGLGGERLKGFFRPAFSTKRLSKNALGKFGIGSKSGLATGVESYQIISVHNGKEYHFDIYADRFYSTISKFSETGEINPHEIWKAKKYKEDGTTEQFDNEIYYIETDKKNGVKILLDVKNPIRNKSKFLDAVKSQLTYFDYVRLFEEYEDDEEKYRNREISFKTDILYKDQHLIIPETNYYSVPHLVLNGVNYGTIDFPELEMDEKKGNVGIIGDPNEIDVNQSRETVRYTEKTRNSIKKYLDNSIKVAQSFVDTEMKDAQDDFIKWTLSCRDLKAKNSRDNVFSRLSGLANLESVEFTHASGLKYNQTNFKKVFAGFKVTKTNVRTTSDGAFKTNTVDVNSWESFNPEYLYFRSNPEDRVSAIAMGYIVFGTDWELDLDLVGSSSGDVYLITPLIEIESESKAVHNLVTSLLEKSASVKNYADINVPDKFVESYKTRQETQEKKEQERVQEAAMTEKEIRKRNGLVLFHKFAWNCGYYGYYRDSSVIRDSELSKTRSDCKLDNLDLLFTKETTVYGTQEDIPLLKNLLTITDNSMTDNSLSGYKKIIWSNSFKVIVVAKDIVKYIDNYATHVKEALQTVENKKLSLMTKIKNFNTARLFKDIDTDGNFRYVSLFESVDKDAFDAYTELKEFIHGNGFQNRYKIDVPGAEDIIEYLDNVKDFQFFLIDEKDPKKISEKSKELFNTPELTSCDAINLDMYAKFKALEDYIEDMKALLKPYSDVIHYAGPVDFNNIAVREYLDLKGIPDYSEFLASRYEELGVSLPSANK